MSPTDKTKKVLLISSCGGHWQQMRRLEAAFVGFTKYYAATDASYYQFVPGQSFYAVPDASQWSKLRLIWQAVCVFVVLVRIRPDVVISTGASVGFFALLFAKLLGKKTIWVDSIANVEQVSLSGKKVKPFADLWISQWEHLAEEHGVPFYGSVL